MNNLEHLENRLRSWKPRHPSPALKSRIFSSPAVVEGVTEPESFLPPWRWWAPVTALTIAALTLLTGQFSLLHVENRTSAGIVATAALNQPDLVAYLPAAGHSEANAWRGTSFEWTNQGSRYTNGLMP
jgi:uncharacterized membrane protein